MKYFKKNLGVFTYLFVCATFATLGVYYEELGIWGILMAYASGIIIGSMAMYDIKFKN